MENINISQIVYETLERENLLPLPAEAETFLSMLDGLRPQLPRGAYDLFYNNFMNAMIAAQEASFTAGWQMRGRV